MKKPVNKISKILVGIVAVLIIVLVVLFIIQIFAKKDSYHAVYLRTGDIYFGKLITFPTFGLRNVYTLQITQDPQNPLRIQKFSDVFWGPSDYLKLNRNEVVWYTELQKDGQLYQLLSTNPNLIPQQQAPQQLQQPTTQPPVQAPIIEEEEL